MQYHVGDIVEGVITGVQPYGAFVNIDADCKGLIHISEISVGYVKDVAKYVHIGEHVKVKILEMDENGTQCKLSLKALQANPKRVRTKHTRVMKVPKMTIGFASLASHLDEWIEKENQGGKK